MRFKFLAILLASILGFGAGVRKEIEAGYNQKYKNKAIFLKTPVRGLRQVVFVTDSGLKLDRSQVGEALAFKVGDQVRITDLDFRADQIRFKISSIDSRRESELVFLFPSRIDEEFSRQKSFEAALADAFTEGLHYKELDSAKEKFIQDQFEQVIQQFAKSTDTSVEFVTKTLSEKNPHYLAKKRQAEESRRRVQKMTQDLQRENRARTELESQLLQSRNQLARRNSELDSARRKQQRSSSQRDSLQKQVTTLQKRNQEYEHQVNELVRGLDVETASKSDLGQRVEALRSERSTLSRKFNEVGRELERFRKSSKNLTEKLERAQHHNTRMRADLRALTSNKNSLEARYIATKKQKEVLENAARLSTAFHLRKRREKRKKGIFEVADLYLLTQKVGVLEVEAPTHPGKIYPVRFSFESPDTVQFTEEERKLYQMLGEKLKVETAWSTYSDRLQVVLSEPEALQSVGPREKVQWSWLFSGQPVTPERVALHVHLINTDGQKIWLEPQEFFVVPGGIVEQLREHFSPLSLLAGTLLGIVSFGLLFGFRGRSRRSSSGSLPDTRRRGDYAAPKKL